VLLLLPAWDVAASALRVQVLPVAERGGRLALQPDGEKAPYRYDEDGLHHLRLAAIAQDEKGRPVRGLSLKQVSLLVDGKYCALTSEEMRVTPAYLGEQGVTLALVVDTSVSMYGAPFAECKKIAAEMLEAAGEGDRLAVVRFADEPKRLCDYITDRSVLRLFVESLTVKVASKGSVLTDAIQVAIEGMPEGAERKAVLVMTDGENIASIATPDRVVTLAQTADCPLFVVGCGQREVKEELLDQLVSGTGGERFKANTPASEILSRIRSALHPHYVVSVKTDKLSADGQSHSLALRVELETGSGASEQIAFVTGVAKAQVFATVAMVLVPVLLVLLTGATLVILTRLHGSREGAAPAPVEGVEPLATPAPGQISLCPVCRRAMPLGETVCPGCGHQEGKVISIDDVGDEG